MDKRKLFRHSEGLRMQAKRDERRLNLHVTGDLESSLRVGLSDLESERRKILTDLQKTRARTSRFTGLKRGDPYTRSEQTMTKYHFQKPPGKSAQDFSHKFMTSSRFRAVSYNAERRQSIDKPEEMDNQPGKKMNAYNKTSDDHYKRVQERVKQFNSAPAKKDTKNTGNEKTDVVPGNEPFPAVKQLRTLKERSMPHINMNTAKNSIARRLGKSPVSDKEPTPPQNDGATFNAWREFTERKILENRAQSDNTLSDAWRKTVEDVVPKYSRYSHSEKRHSRLVNVEDFLANPVFDPDLYGADGHLRTVHVMPNFDDMYSEAKKAKYIRHGPNFKPDFEQELNVMDIFNK